jgi:glycosyltransferase involved in cell wall biosynthesis
MKVAYFSPFPPQRTGIATYSARLVSELQKVMAVQCYDAETKVIDELQLNIKGFSIQSRVNDLASFDAIFYNLGNNPHYHLWIYRVLRQWPGIVILHDVVLYYLFAGAGRDAFVKHFFANYGYSRISELERLIDACPNHDLLRYPHPERYPLIGSIFPYARQIVVHNRAAQAQIRSLGYFSPIHVVPQLGSIDGAAQIRITDKKATKDRFGIRRTELLIGSFGFIGPTKRLDKLCQALRQLKGELEFTLLIVGEGEDVSRLVSENGLESDTIVTGFVAEEDFRSLLDLTDIVVNLRHPSMGESSWTLNQAMAIGKACIVTDDASFKELTEDCVCKIRHDASEVADLVSAIRRLKDTEMRRMLGIRARKFAEQAWRAARIVEQFKAIAENEESLHKFDDVTSNTSETERTHKLGRMFRAALVAALPEPLMGSFFNAPPGEPD